MSNDIKVGDRVQVRVDWFIEGMEQDLNPVYARVIGIDDKYWPVKLKHENGDIGRAHFRELTVIEEEDYKAKFESLKEALRILASE